MLKEVKKVIEEIRPNIQLDGGDIELASVDEKTGTVTVKFKGACVGCPMSSITLHAGIAKELKDKIPAVKEVLAFDDEGDLNSQDDF